MKIGHAAKQAGLTVKTIRYYADIGLVIPHQDAQTSYRDYSEEDVAKLHMILALMNAASFYLFIKIKAAQAVK